MKNKINKSKNLKNKFIGGILGLTFLLGSTSLLAGCEGQQGPAGTPGSTWYSGPQYSNEQGVLGDYFYDTDDYKIYKKREEGWSFISSIKSSVTINSDGYWVIDNETTSYKASGQDGLTPYIKNGTWWIGEENLQIDARGIEGKSAYDLAVEQGFDGDIDEWLESLKGQNGNTWFTGKDSPDETLGQNNDLYLDEENYIIYKKIDNKWTIIGNLCNTKSEESKTFNFDDLTYNASTSIDDYTGKIIKASTSNTRVIMSDLLKVNPGDRIRLTDTNYRFIIYGYNDAEGSYLNHNQYIDANPEDSTSSQKNWGNDFTFTEGIVYGNGKEVSYPLYIRLTIRCSPSNSNTTLFPEDIKESFIYDVKTDNSHLIKEEIKIKNPAAPEFYNTHIISHRGLSSTAPENTLAAFNEAFESGVKIMEADIQITSDNIPVLLHDTTVDRTSNGTGSIRSMTLAQAKEFDYGSWKDEKYAGETIPTLKEFLTFCKARNILCELDLASKTFTDEQKKAIYSVVEAVGMLDKTIFTATHAELVDYLTYNSELIVSISGITSLEVAESVLPYYIEQNIAFASIPIANLSEELVAYIHSIGLKVKVWTINDTTTLQTALSYGVDMILSDSLTKLY